ncbi:hypothetical protein BH11GEM2_BH11GEM2_25590 [soil metagenome]
MARRTNQSIASGGVPTEPAEPCSDPTNPLPSSETWPSLVRRFGYYDAKFAEAKGEEVASLFMAFVLVAHAADGNRRECWWGLPSALAFLADNLFEADACALLVKSEADWPVLALDKAPDDWNERIRAALRTVPRARWAPLVLHRDAGVRLAVLRFLPTLPPTHAHAKTPSISLDGA